MLSVLRWHVSLPKLGSPYKRPLRLPHLQTPTAWLVNTAGCHLPIAWSICSYSHLCTDLRSWSMTANAGLLIASFTRDVNMPTTHAYNVVPYPAPPRCFLLLATVSSKNTTDTYGTHNSSIGVGCSASRWESIVGPAYRCHRCRSPRRATYIVQHVSAY